MTSFKQVKNNAKTHVATNGLNNITSPVTFSVGTGEGNRFPTVTNGYWVTFYDDTTYTDPFDDPLMEIGLVTDKTGDSFTVTRSQLGTSAQAHTGSPAMRLLIVDQQIIDLQTATNNLENKMPSGTVVGTTDVQALTNKDMTDTTNTFPYTVVTLSGLQNMANKKLHTITADGMYDNGTVMGTFNIDWSKGDVQKVTVSGATTFTYSNAQIGQRLTLRVQENITGGYTIAIPSSKYPSGTAPTYTTTTSGINLIVALYDGMYYLTQASVGFA